MAIKIHIFLIFMFFVFVPFLIGIDAARISNELDISDQRKPDPKASKFLFSTNVVFSDGGFNEKFYCLADCLKKASIDEENRDEKFPEGFSDPRNILAHARLLSNYAPQPNKTLSTELLVNIGLNKPTKAAFYEGHDGGNPHLPRNAVDGDERSMYISRHVSNPWWIVELGQTYKIVKISYISRPGSGGRSVGVQFYVADDIPYLCNGGPNISNLTLFDERAVIPIGTDKTDHAVPEGHYGSKVLVYKPTHNTHLEIAELQISGYLYE